MEKRGANKRGDIQLSFGMMFSMFLIVVFIVVAIIAINAFLGVQCSVSSGQFIKDFQAKVNELYASSGQDVPFKSSLGNCKIDYVCFFDSEKRVSGSSKAMGEEFEGKITAGNNLYFYPAKSKDFLSVNIKYIDMSKFSENPYCIKVAGGNVEIRLTKELEDVYVKVS